MAAARPQILDDQPSPGLSINLSSNNPFRNRATSPLPKSPVSPFNDPSSQSQSQPERPVSNNPFLDSTQKPTSSSIADPPPLITMADEKETATTTTSATEDLFASLNIDDKDKDKDTDKDTDKDKSKSTGPPPTSRRPPPPRGENMPPGRRGPPPPPGHRSRGSGPSGPNSPPRRMASSAGRSRGPSRPLTEDEKKRRDRERERRHRDGKKAKPHRDHDLIDKLDETNPFGASLVHHAGPYDAVFSKKKKNSPLEAFAKDSANMSMGGSGPINARADHSTFMGRANDEAFADYGISVAPPTKKDVAVFDPHDRASMIHGDETVGLGTSTFLEGTPAAKAAVEKAQQENFQPQDGGLQRKKSLAQRIRGMNRPQRDFSASGRMTNPEGVYRDRASAGGSMTSPRGENNPFFAEYEPGKDGEEEISVKKLNDTSPTSPRLPGGLERRATTDTLNEPPKQKTGLLGRMKSLKGGPRSRPVDRDFGNAE